MKKNLKKRLAMVLAAAMVFSTPVAVNNTVSAAAEEESALETITGAGWWDSSNQKSKQYNVTEETPVELYVVGDEAAGGAVMLVEISDGTTFLTTGSHYEAWGVDGITGAKDRDDAAFAENHIYKITISLDNKKDCTIQYYDTTKDEVFVEYKANISKMTDPKVYVMAQIGTFKVSSNKMASVSVTGPAIKAEEGAKALAYSFDAIDAPAGTGFEVSVSNGTETVTGSAVAAEGGHVTYNYPEKGALVSGTYTFKVTGVKAGAEDNTNYLLDGDAADSVTVEAKDGVITGTKETVTVKLTDGKAALTADKKSIDYTFKAENAPAKGTFEYAVSKGDAVVATGSAAAVAEVKVNYAPTESGKYSFKVTGVKADESDKAVYVLDGEAAAELDFTVPSGDNNPNPPASNPPASNPPASNPPATNPPAAGTVKKVTVKAQNQKAGTKTVYLKKGGKVTLTATVTGTGKFSKAVTWTSSKKAVATVSSKGVVKAKKAGTAKITAASKTNKAKKATITIKVAKKAKKNKKLTLKARKKNLKKGKTYTVAIKSMTKGTTDAVTYKTNKKKIATVDKFGVVKAKKKGTAVITVKCGSKKAKLTIKVK